MSTHYRFLGMLNLIDINLQESMCYILDIKKLLITQGV
jgi:hypothetical protein